MSWRSDFVESQWRWAKRFFVFFPFWVLLIIGINIWHDAQGGQPFNVRNLLIALGILAFAGVVFLFSKLIFRFVRSVMSHEERWP